MWVLGNRRDPDDDIDVYLDKHDLAGFATALDLTHEYVDGPVNHRTTFRIERFRMGRGDRFAFIATAADPHQRLVTHQISGNTVAVRR